MTLFTVEQDSQLFPFGAQRGDADVLYDEQLYWNDDGFVRKSLPQEFMFGCRRYSSIWVRKREQSFISKVFVFKGCMLVCYRYLYVHIYTYLYAHTYMSYVYVCIIYMSYTYV